MPVCLHWRRGLQAGSRAPSPGFRGLSFWSRFLSVRCLGSGELLMSADRVRHSVSRGKKKKKALSLLYPHTHTHTRTYASTYSHAYMHFSMLHKMETYLLTSEKKAKLGKSRASSKWLLFASFLSVCVYLNGEYSGLYPYKSFPILSPLVRSPHISYQALSSNSLDLPYCRSLSPLFTLAPFSFLSFVFFFFLF